MVLDIGEEASVDGGTCEPPVCEERGEEGSPLTSGLLEALERAIEAAHKRLAVFAEGRDARWHTHVELLGQVGLEVSLPNVDLREIEVTGGGDNEHQADGRGLDNCGKYAIVVDAVLLRIAISNKAGLNFSTVASRRRLTSKT